ncbi:MAG: hypothetical protein Q8M09_02190 [Pseudomonadota bacterium]|nr:hypothetical protein [Pseudomonadota bacterium]MDP1903053.1 hypothetical protein [Pseudomonadota bacterium]
MPALQRACSAGVSPARRPQAGLTVYPLPTRVDWGKGNQMDEARL